jgi:predicted RNA binding protein YcfA (HicA-like mRNA interferase family)
MARLPRVSGKEMVDFLVRRGFAVIRVRGSHHFLESGSHRTCVPVHTNRPLKIGTLRSILRDIEMSPVDFEREHREN